jgi:hypothetical protein
MPGLDVKPKPLAVGDVMQRVGRGHKGPRIASRTFRPRWLDTWLRRITSRAPRGLRPRTLGPQVTGPGVYEASPAQVAAVRKLAVPLLAAVLLSLLPVVWCGHLGLGASPGWARTAVLVAGLQVLYVVWMINAPDWATVRVVMCVFAAVATGYAVATTAVMATAVDHPLALGLGAVRHRAAAWCGAMVLVMGLGTFLAGRLSTRWRRLFLRETAQRGGQ